MYSPAQIKMSLKITVCESLENSWENVYVEVYFSKVARLQCKDSNLTISRINQRFSSEYAPNISCLKKNNLRKMSEVYQRFSNVVTCEPKCTAHSLIKNRAHVKYFRRSAEKILM